MFHADILGHVCLYFFNMYKIVIQLLRARVSTASVLLDNVKLVSKDTVQVFLLVSAVTKVPFVYSHVSSWHCHTLKLLPIKYLVLSHFIDMPILSVKLNTSFCPPMCLVTQSCPTLCKPMNCSPPGSSVHGILQARILEWDAFSFSKGSSWPRDLTQVSCTAGRFFIVWATGDIPFCKIFVQIFCQFLIGLFDWFIAIECVCVCMCM